MAALQFDLDQNKLDSELLGRSGQTGRVLAGFAGLATREINSTFRRRAGGEWWPTESSIKMTSTKPSMEIVVTKTRPHVIKPRKAGGVLVFETTGGQTVFARRVNHPGSTPPVHLIQAGVAAAGAKFNSLNIL